MKFLFCLIGFMSSVFVGGQVMAETFNLMVFGDSLSSGYNIPAQSSFVSQLEKALKEKGYDLNAINYSKSGETTAGAVKKVYSSLKKDPDAVILQLGSNDVFAKKSVEDIAKNLQILITVFKEENLPIFLIGMEAPLNLPKEYRDAFRKMYETLADENDLLLYPFFMEGLWQSDGQPEKKAYFLPDGVHPSAEGVAEMVRRILPSIEQFLQEDCQ